MKKRLFALILSIILLVALACPVTADSNISFDTMVVDMAEVLTDAEVRQLNAQAWELTQNYRCAVYIVTTNDLEGYEPWRYSEIMHEQLGMGYGAEQSCIILLLSISSREYDIMAHGYGNTAFTDYGKEVMSERFLDEFGENDWYGGFIEYLDCCGEFLRLAQDGKPFDVRSDNDPVTSVLLSAAIALVIAFIVCTIFKYQMKTARRQTTARGYISDRGMVLTAKNDRFVHTTRTERYIPPQNKNNRPGSRGGTTVNSRGSSHRSGRF